MFYNLVFYYCVCQHMWCVNAICAEALGGPKSPFARVQGGCEWLDMGVGNQTQAFCKNSKHPEPLSHFSSLSTSNSITGIKTHSMR